MVSLASLKNANFEVVAELRGIENPRFCSEDASAFGAMSCFSRDTSIALFEKKAAKHQTNEELAKFREGVLSNSIGKGHLAVLDPSQYLIACEDIPRLATLFLCSDQYRTHLQQSLRRVDIEENDLFLPEVDDFSPPKENDLFIPTSLKNTESGKNFIDLFNDNFKLYQDMTGKGNIAREIARGVMPLYLTTAIQTEGSGRAWWDAFIMGARAEMPSAIQSLTSKMKPALEKISPGIFKDRENVKEPLNYMPSSQLFWPKNESLKAEINKYARNLDDVILRDFSGTEFITEESMRKAVEERDLAELSNLKHAHFTFLWPMSIYIFHQSTRQKTLDQAVESIYDAIERKAIICPPEIKKSEFVDKYLENSNRGIDLFKEGVKAGLPAKELLGYIPHNLIIYDKVHINGWNAIYMVGIRACREAQGEINHLAKQTAKIIEEKCPPLGKYSQPRGVIYGRCPDNKWDTCGYCKGILQKRNK